MKGIKDHRGPQVGPTQLSTWMSPEDRPWGSILIYYTALCSYEKQKPLFWGPPGCMPIIGGGPDGKAHGWIMDEPTIKIIKSLTNGFRGQEINGDKI